MKGNPRQLYIKQWKQNTSNRDDWNGFMNFKF